MNPGNTAKQNAQAFRLRVLNHDRAASLSNPACGWRNKTLMGKTYMQQAPLDARSAESSGYVLYFQLASNGARRACSLTIHAENANEAARIFRENWGEIESMARDGVSTGMVGKAPVSLTMS